MTPEERLATFLEQGRFADGEDAAVAADDEMLATATRLRGQLTMPEVWEAPPDGLLDLILADIERERQQGMTDDDAPLAPVVDLPGLPGVTASDAAAPGAEAPPTEALPTEVPQTAETPVAQPPSVDAAATAPPVPGAPAEPPAQPEPHPEQQPEQQSATVTPIPLGRRARAVRWGTGLVAAAAVAAAALIITVPRGEETEVALSGTSAMPGASATAILRDTDSGLEITLDVSGLAPLPEGYYYQGWLKGERGTVTIGTFHAREGAGEVVLWSGVPLEDYPTLTVTKEPEDGNPASSGVVVMTSKP